MASKLFTVFAALASLQSTFAKPIESIESAIQAAQAAQAANELLAESWTLNERAECSGQSCVVADLAGSTGRLPKFQPEGGAKSGFKCIAKYNPKGVEAAQTAPKIEKQSTGASSSLLSGLNTIQNALTFRGPTDTGKFNGRCAKNIVIFAKGTTEPGELGITVGPVLSSGLRGRDWLVVGVPYDADVPGDYCLGLPGGMVARDMLNQASTKCPDSKIFMSGYSQGGMVAHNGIAYANPEARSKVAGVIVFGDPFQGAKIKGYKGPIITYCNKGDGVCTGNFEISGAHLSYTGGPSTQAIAQFKKLAAE